MKAINRQLQRLEDRLGLGSESEEDRRLRERLETFRRLGQIPLILPGDGGEDPTTPHTRAA
jgi:hypothetical protein